MVVVRRGAGGQQPRRFRGRTADARVSEAACNQHLQQRRCREAEPGIRVGYWRAVPPLLWYREMRLGGRRGASAPLNANSAGNGSPRRSTDDGRFKPIAGDRRDTGCERRGLRGFSDAFRCICFFPLALAASWPGPQWTGRTWRKPRVVAVGWGAERRWRLIVRGCDGREVGSCCCYFVVETSPVFRKRRNQVCFRQCCAAAEMLQCGGMPTAGPVGRSGVGL